MQAPIQSPTAANLTPAQRDTYRAILARQATARHADLDQRRERGWSLARDAARQLRERFGVTEVWAFGSLVAGRGFHDRLDIDLAVRGLPVAVYLDAMVLLLSLDGDFLFDLVRLEDASEGLREQVLTEGAAL